MMNRILLIGAGRSSTILISYLLREAQKYNWTLTVADSNPQLGRDKIGRSPHGKSVYLDAGIQSERRVLIQGNDIVISMLPPELHTSIANDCIDIGRHLITASYISQQIYDLAERARSRKLIFMGELGLDPGIDHMSASQKINEIKSKGGKIKAFRSYAGGLVAPESDDNPWHYKFTWNPSNVVRAGQGTAQYLEDGNYKYIPYNSLFRRFRMVDIIGAGQFEMYANRDSLLYRQKYGLEGIPTIIRGTLRYPGFCRAWDALVQLGITDASYPIINSADLTYRQFLEGYVDGTQTGTLKERVAKSVAIDPGDEVMKKLVWLGLFEDKPIRIPLATPALILEDLLLEKWKLRDNDRDMIVMQHEIDFVLNNQNHKAFSTLILKGNHAQDTAMSKLVGLPLGVFVKYVMLGKIRSRGVHIPVLPEFYEPILGDLREMGIRFTETEARMESANQ